MSQIPITRREFAALVAAGAVAVPATGSLAAPRRSSSRAVTANEIVDRIKKNIGVEWKTETVDTVKAGDLSTVVTGVVTTSLATMAVLQQAVKAGANLIITGAPTFYSRADGRTPSAGRGGGGRGAVPGSAPAPPPPPPPADPIFAAKNDFITRNNLVVFRLSDHWRLRKPDPLAQGIGTALGWTKYQVAGDVSRYDIPAISLDALASGIKKTFNSRGGMRVVGDPQARIQKVALLPGSTPITSSLVALPGVDLVVAGEVREWESAEYARDVVFSGQRKGFILVGRLVSEEAGMTACAKWLETVVPEVPVRHLPAGDPYWRPA
jgi:putative NIF3 family GTP cyclohydrolase 1 type 2